MRCDNGLGSAKLFGMLRSGLRLERVQPRTVGVDHADELAQSAPRTPQDDRGSQPGSVHGDGAVGNHSAVSMALDGVRPRLARSECDT